MMCERAGSTSTSDQKNTVISINNKKVIPNAFSCSTDIATCNLNLGNITLGGGKSNSHSGHSGEEEISASC
jgi:hypothetical protein